MSDYDTVTEQINTLVKTPAPAGTMFSNLDQQRDLTVKKLESDYNAQTTVMTVNKQVKDVVGFFKKAFGGTKSELAQNKHTIARQTGPVIQQLLILVASVAIIYFMGSNLGPLVHFAAFVLLVTGTYYIISGSPNNGESTVSSVFSAISNFSSSIWNAIASSL